MFVVEIESFTWIILYDVIMRDIVYMMILCNNWIMQLFCELELYDVSE